MSHIFLV